MVGALSGALLLGVTTVNIGVSLDAYVAHRDVVEVYLSMLLLEAVRARDGGAKQRQRNGQRQALGREQGQGQENGQGKSNHRDNTNTTNNTTTTNNNNNNQQQQQQSGRESMHEVGQVGDLPCHSLPCPTPLYSNPMERGKCTR